MTEEKKEEVLGITRSEVGSARFEEEVHMEEDLGELKEDPEDETLLMRLHEIEAYK